MKRNKLSVAVIAALGLTPVAYVYGEESGIREEIVVTGVRASLKEALDQKRESAKIVDAISAEDIGKFPDLNISESLQRIPGVAIGRSLNGEGSRITIRGLPSQFVRTTLNGAGAVTAGSNGNDISRSFDFDIFASELFTNARVSKSQSASDLEGGISGIVDLSTPKPFDLDGFVLSLSANGQIQEKGGVDGNYFDDIDQRLSALFSYKNSDETFGATFSIAYAESSARGDTSESFRYQETGSAFLDRTIQGIEAGDTDLADINVNGQSVTLAELREISDTTVAPSLPRYGPSLVERERLGFTSSFQFKPSENLLLGLDVLYGTFDDGQLRPTIDGLTGFGRRNVVPTNINIADFTTPGFRVSDDGSSLVPVEVSPILTGTLQNISQRSETVEELFDTEFMHITFDAEWDINDSWKADFLLSQSESSEFEIRRTYLFDFFGDFSFDLTDPLFPVFSGDGFDRLDPSSYSANQLRFRPRDRDNEESSVKVDFTWDRGGESVKEVKFGVRYSDTVAEQSRGELRTSFDADFSDFALLVPVDNFVPNAPAGAPLNYLITDPDLGRSFLLPDGTPFPLEPVNTYTINEEVLSAFIQADADLDLGGMPLFVNFGVRAVFTDQTSDGSQLAGGVAEAVSINNSYSDILPSVNARLNITDDLVLRATVNKAITRPNLNNLSPGISVNPTLRTASAGNPNLDPFRATQFDLGLEWYFDDEALLAATVFYKDIESFISSDTSQEVITGTNLVDDDGNNVSGELFTVTRPVNGDSGELYGLELSYQQPFTFLPEPFDGFGALANVTLVDSEGTRTVGGVSFRDELAGVSDLSYNLVGYYEKENFSVRLAWSFRSDRLDTFESRGGLFQERRTEERGQLDVSARYDLSESLSLTFNGLNLNGDDFYSFDGDRRLNRTYTDQGRVLVFGVRYDFN